MSLRQMTMTMGALLVLVLPGAADAIESGCVDASARAAQAVAEKRWSDAITLLEAAVKRPECTSVRTEQQFSLAYAIEQSDPTGPDSACRAEELYRSVQRATAEEAIIEGVRRGLARVGPICRRCRAADPYITRGEWDRAERILRGIIDLDACAEMRPTMALKLARVEERLSARDPQRACDAAVHYGEATASPSSTVLREARDGQTRMQLRCAGGAEAGASPTGSRALEWTLTIASGAALVTGGVLLGAQLAAGDDRDRALTDFEAAIAPPPDAERAAAAEARFEDANDRVGTYRTAGWSMVAVGALLGAGAVWAWVDEASAVALRLGPGGGAVVVDF